MLDLKSYDENGFILAKEVLDIFLLRDLKWTLQEMFFHHAKSGESLYDTCARLDKEDKPTLYKLFQITQKLSVFDPIKQICLDYVKELLPNDGYYITITSGVLFGLPEDKRLVYNWHQESNYMPTMKHFINFWFPIFEPATKENGTMSCLVGSHKLGQLPYDKQKLATNAYTDLVPKNIEEIEKQHKEFHFEAKPGYLAMFDQNLIHRSNSNQSPRTRFSGIVRIACLSETPTVVNFTNDDY